MKSTTVPILVGIPGASCYITHLRLMGASTLITISSKDAVL